jgi:hypothetical protein
MPDQNRIADKIVGEDGNRQRFHQGKHPQGGIPSDLTEEEQRALEVHMDSIHAPESKPRWGTDEDGEPVEVSEAGLIVTDPLTGAVEPLTEESLARSEKNQALRAEQAEARYASGAAGAAPPPLPAAEARPGASPSPDRRAAASREAEARPPRRDAPPTPDKS